MSLKKFVQSTIAIIVALYISTVTIIVFNNISIYNSITRGINDSFYEINPIRRDFRYACLGYGIFLIPIFFLFSSWGKNNLRKILVPCIILGILFSQLQYLSWWAPEVSGIQVVKGFFHGAFIYLLFYGSYWLILRALERSNIRKAKT